MNNPLEKKRIIPRDGNHPASSVVEVARGTYASKSPEDENLLHAVVGWIADPLFIKDIDGGYVLVNSACANLMEHPVDYIIGKKDSELFPEEIASFICASDEKVITTEETMTEELPFAIRGEKRTYRVTKGVYRNGKGDVIGIIGIARNVTERKRTEEVLRLLAEAGNVLIASLEYEKSLEDLAKLLVPRFAQWCVVHVVEDCGKIRRIALVHADKKKIKLADEIDRQYPLEMSDRVGIAAVLRTGKSAVAFDVTEQDLTLFAKDAEHLKALRGMGFSSAMIVPLIARERVIGAITFIHDDPRFHYSVEDLAFAEEFARRAAIAIDNARLYRELREADRAKDDFLAILSHELRNPLAPALTALELIRNHTVTADVRTSTELIERQLGNMARLLDDLLDVSRITRGKVQLRKEPVDLAVVMRNAVDTVGARIKKHSFSVTFPGEPVVIEGDPVRLEQILINLLNNAIKYTEAGGGIILCGERCGDEAVVRIRDSGIGISKGMLPKIFDLFIQVNHSLARSQGGLGIGLTLVRSLVEMHGGRVEVASDGLGKGTEFVVRIPVMKSIGLAVEAPKKEAGMKGAVMADSSVRRKVLVVDDNADAANSMGKLLEVCGYDMKIAYDSEEALDLADSYLPDIVLLDIGLPTRDGYQVAREIRKRYPGRRILLVAVSGYGQDEDKRKSREAGFDCHFTKPIDFASIKNIIDKLPR